MSLLERVKDFFDRDAASRASEREEVVRLEDELKGLANEARYHEEPSYQSDLARKRGDLERETRILFYEVREPQRAQLQGRCQALLESIERPDVVQSRIAEVRSRLASLGEGIATTDAAYSGEGDANHKGE